MAFALNQLPVLPAALKPPTPPELVANSYLLKDYHSGQILMEKDSHKRVEPASLTKLVTAYVVFSELYSGHLKLTDSTKISEKAWKMEGSRMYLKLGSAVTVEELLKGMIIQSGNDASVALAEMIAGDETAFAALMNQYAEHLGMKESHYINSTGMPDPAHYTTVHDMMIISEALIRNFPEYYPYYSQKEYTYNKITQQNRNDLLWRDNSVDGIKTGHTNSAGYCLVVSAKRDNMRLISIIMGTESAKVRIAETQKMLTYGFRFFESVLLYPAGKKIENVRVWQGKSQNLELGLKQDLYLTVPRGEAAQIVTQININQPLIAPINKHSPQGEIIAQYDHKIRAKRPLLALQTVAQGNVFEQIWDRILLFIQNLWNDILQ
jgi:D-alanyl-D-alanine carboxypeptidase (penicillin-binding protein 5/6)